MNFLWRTPLLLGLVALLAALALSSGCSLMEESKQENVARSAPPPSARIPADEPVARVASQVEPSVVQINVRVARQTPFGPQSAEGMGSGVIYREDGYIITNAHVVKGADEVQVAFADGSTEEGRVVGADPNTEVAVVKVDRDDLPAAKFAAGENLLVGQLAVAVGSPSGFESTVTSGVVSGLSREFPSELTGGQPIPSLVDLIQTDAAISPGSSGGALADRDGEIIGVNVAYLPPAETGAVNIGFAIPSDTATSVADQLIETGEVRSPYLGVRLADLSPEEARRFGTGAESGAIVAEVVAGSAAEEAGVGQGDVIIALDNQRIETSGDVLGALRDYRPGDTTEITVVREGEEITLEVTLDERPE